MTASGSSGLPDRALTSCGFGIVKGGKIRRVYCWRFGIASIAVPAARALKGKRKIADSFLRRRDR
jgi:hypothetical protein